MCLPCFVSYVPSNIGGRGPQIIDLRTFPYHRLSLNKARIPMVVMVLMAHLHNTTIRIRSYSGVCSRTNACKDVSNSGVSICFHMPE
jgi:hypothetical protein